MCISGKNDGTIFHTKSRTRTGAIEYILAGAHLIVYNLRITPGFAAVSRLDNPEVGGIAGMENCIIEKYVLLDVYTRFSLALTPNFVVVRSFTAKLTTSIIQIVMSVYIIAVEYVCTAVDWFHHWGIPCLIKVTNIAVVVGVALQVGFRGCIEY